MLCEGNRDGCGDGGENSNDLEGSNDVVVPLIGENVDGVVMDGAEVGCNTPDPLLRDGANDVDSFSCCVGDAGDGVLLTETDGAVVACGAAEPLSDVSAGFVVKIEGEGVGTGPKLRKTGEGCEFNNERIAAVVASNHSFACIECKELTRVAAAIIGNLLMVFSGNVLSLIFDPLYFLVTRIIWQKVMVTLSNTENDRVDWKGRFA